MNFSKYRKGKKPVFMIIPMIDIIFFLLVFFMMSTLYMTEPRTIPVNLPPAVTAKQDVVKSLNVTVGTGGALYLGTEAMPLDALAARLTAEARTADIAVVLRADRDVDYGRFIAVMDALKKTGIGRISLAAKE